MKAELIHEFQLLQQSRANKFAELLSEQIKTSVDVVNEKISSSLSQRGKMLLLLERKLSLSHLKGLRKKYFKF